MVLEYLDSNESGARSVTPWIRNLEKLGIELRFRPVDFALYQQRLRAFEFDIISIAYGGTNNPGAEYADLFGSVAAKTEDSGNFAGVSSPAVDALVEPHDRSQHTTGFPGRLPCTGPGDQSQPLPHPTMVGDHAPHGLQHLASRTPGNHAALCGG